jgi:membrane-bound lytic murein transglycosylase
VRAHRSGDNAYSNYSNVSSATTTGCPLPAPSSLTANALSSSQINLSWSDNSTDETSFRVERSPNGTSSWDEIGIVAANTTSYSNTVLSSCTTYYYRVRAHRSGDNVYSSYSNVSSATTTGCPLPAPSSLSANALSSSQINLSWSDNSTDETSFRVERSPNGTSSWDEIGNVAANTTSYSNTGLSSCTTYYYRVRAHRSGDNVYSSYSNVSSATTTGCPLPAPSSLSANALSSSQINLSWSDNSTDETSFRVERSPNGTSSWDEIGNVAANTTSYSNTVLSSCTTYYYRVRAHRSGDNVYSSYSNVSSATTTGCPLPAPSSLTANALSSSQINLSWSDNSTDETSFRVERSPNGTSSWDEIGNVAANTTSYSNTVLSSCTTYYYRVRAHRSGDNVYSSYSNVSSATTTGCPLPAPSSLSANALSSSQINLSWSDNSTDETSFRVERSPNGTSSWDEIGIVAANTTSYSNTVLSSCTTYYYRVRAHRSGDNVYSSYSNVSSATTTGCPLPAPSSLSANALSSSQINLSWSDNSTDETSFRVERSPNGTSSWDEIGNVAANTTSYSNTVLSSCTTYYYRVRAHRSGDNVYSSYSNVSSATTTGCPLLAPSSLTANALSSSQINLSWSDNSTDETSFRVERSPNGTSSWDEIGNVAANTTSYSNTVLSSCTTYYYRVRAHRSGDNVYSSYSNVSSATTTGCPLLAPSSLTANALSSSQINLSWSDNSTDETSFRVERSPNGTSSWDEIGNVAANTTSYSNTVLSSCTTYYYRVRAHRSGDNVYSSYSNVSSATTTGCPLPAPSSLSASDGTYTDRVYVSWIGVSGATSYQVFRCTTTSTSSCGTALSSPSSTNYNDYGATAGVTYYYRAKACNLTGCSDFSTADPGFRSQPSVHNIYLPLIISGGGTTSTILNGGFK